MDVRTVCFAIAHKTTVTICSSNKSLFASLSPHSYTFRSTQIDGHFPFAAVDPFKWIDYMNFVVFLSFLTGPR